MIIIKLMKFTFLENVEGERVNWNIFYPSVETWRNKATHTVCWSYDRCLYNLINSNQIIIIFVLQNEKPWSEMGPDGNGLSDDLSCSNAGDNHPIEAP